MQLAISYADAQKSSTSEFVSTRFFSKSSLRVDDHFAELLSDYLKKKSLLLRAPWSSHCSNRVLYLFPAHLPRILRGEFTSSIDIDLI